MMKRWLSICGLIGLDQIIKLIIYRFFMIEFPILPPLFYFSPVFNRSYSWLNSLFDWGISRSVHIVFGALILLFLILIFLFVQKRYSVSRLCSAGFLFMISGATCSLIDKIFWNGSLDYIYLNGFFTFDLKDLFLNTAIILFVLFLFIHWKDAAKFDEKQFFKELWTYYIPTKDKPKKAVKNEVE